MAGRARRKRWLGPLVVLLVAILGVGVASALLLFDDEGLEHPDEWDPRIVELAAFVERERGLRFEHPVLVEFLSPEEYTAAATDDAGELDDDDRRELDATTAWLRALGVISGPLDLFAALNQQQDGGTAAFYRPDDERVRVRGTELNVHLQSVLVHELTHALQDQHFPIQEMVEDDDSSISTAARALIEGDALRIEQAWVAELSDADLEAYASLESATIDASDIATEGLPGILGAAQATPYLLGFPFVNMLHLDGGNDAVDDAFGRPPTTEEHLFDPVSYLLEEGGDAPDLGLGAAGVSDDDIIDEDTFGSPTLYLLLADRIDPLVGFEAALGWDGDRYATYEADGRTCIRAVFRGDTEDDEGEMAAAIAEWAAAVPGGLAQGIEVDGRPGFDACDPGEDLDLQVPDRFDETIFLASRYASLTGELVEMIGAERARCIGRAIALASPYEDFVSPDISYFSSDAFQDLALSSSEACGSGDR